MIQSVKLLEDTRSTKQTGKNPFKNQNEYWATAEANLLHMVFRKQNPIFSTPPCTHTTYLRTVMKSIKKNWLEILFTVLQYVKFPSLYSEHLRYLSRALLYHGKLIWPTYFCYDDYNVYQCTGLSFPWSLPTSSTQTRQLLHTLLPLQTFIGIIH